MGTEEKAYWNKDIAQILAIGESTVRKWCLELERNGYTFIRGYKDSRAFLQHDLNALIKFKSLTKEGHFTVEQAAKMVVDQYGEREEGNQGNSRTLPVQEESKRSLQSIEENLKELVRVSTEQLEINKRLLEKIEKRDELIEEQQKKLDLMSRMSENRALIEQPESSSQANEQRSSYDTDKEEKQKKKRLTERISNFFKK